MSVTFDPNMLAGLFVFWLVWLLAAYNLVRGIRQGKMVGYGRGENAAAGHLITLRRHKISFCLLFLFYAAVTILVPLATMHVAHERGGLNKLLAWQPAKPPPENARSD